MLIEAFGKHWRHHRISHGGLKLPLESVASKILEGLSTLFATLLGGFCEKFILRLCLDTIENYKLKTKKYCNKIIFKYVNSTVKPTFNEKVAEK